MNPYDELFKPVLRLIVEVVPIGSMYVIYANIWGIKSMASHPGADLCDWPLLHHQTLMFPPKTRDLFTD